MMKKEDSEKALELAMAHINKEYGANSIVALGDKPMTRWPSIPTGSMSLDIALGIGGIPKGRVIEIYGPESSGKTTLCLEILAQAQKAGGKVAIIDAEHALDPSYAEAIGVDTSRLLLAQPSSGEEGLNIASRLTKTGALDVIVVDSVAALTPKAELEGEVGDSHVGRLARLMAQALRMITADAANTGTTIIFINQIREKIGVMFGCLHADTLVNFTDGRAIPIREVVENQIEGEVWSYNEDNGYMEPKKIIDWHHNGLVESKKDWVTIATSGLNILTVTPDHKILTPDGWLEAKDIRVGDPVIAIDGSAESVTRKKVGIRYLFEKRDKYDISIEDNHNYSAGGGIIVHNSPETTTGGRSLKYYSSVRMDIRSIEKLKAKSDGSFIGSRARVKVVKNKMAPPFREAEFDIMYGSGIDRLGTVVDLAVEYDIIKKSGAWFSYEGEQLGQGKVNTVAALASDMEMLGAIENKIREESGLCLIQEKEET